MPDPYRLRAMRESFGMAAALAVVAIALLWFVPAIRGQAVQLGQRRDDGALTGAGHTWADAPRGHVEMT